LKPKKKSSDDQKETKKHDIEEEKDSGVDYENCEKEIESKIYQGLLFIEKLCNVNDDSISEYFVTYEGFWNEFEESTQVSVGLVFNYLKVYYLAIHNRYNNLNDFFCSYFLWLLTVLF
jgi:hypothetical protein